MLSARGRDPDAPSISFKVENGWRGPIPGIARAAGLVPRGANAIIVIRREDKIAVPKVGDELVAGDARWMVAAVANGRSEITLSCTRI